MDLPSRSPLIRLSDCIQLMQADLLHANPTAENLEHLVSGVLLYDPLDAWADGNNRIVLAVGITAGSADFERMLHQAAVANAAAVVIKAHGATLGELKAASVRHKMALLVAEDDADWTSLAALARTSVLGATADTVSGSRIGDLFAFANSVASITNGATSIVDTVGRVLGYSTLPGQPIDEQRRMSTLALQEATPPAFDKDFKTVYASRGGCLIRSADGIFDRLALAVRAGGELLGSIWVIDPGKDRHEVALAALDRLAPLAGLHMLHARSSSDFGSRKNDDQMRTLLDDPKHASFAATQLGIDATHGLAVAAFCLTSPDAGGFDAMREYQRLLHLVTTSCNVHFNRAYCALIDSVVYALLPCSGPTPRVHHRRIALEIGGYSQSISPYPVMVAIGGIARMISELSRSKTEALRTLQLCAADWSANPGARANSTAAAFFEDYRTRLSLIELGSYIRQHGLDANDDIERIRAHDAAHQTDYLITLRAYLESNASISAVASLLQVHNNTVRYRISRLVDELLVELDNPTTRLWLWLRLVSSA